MESQAKKRIPFNIVDIAIVLVILGAAAFFVWRYVYLPRGGSTAANGAYYNYKMTVDNLEIPNDYFEGKINIGDELVDKTTGIKLGVVVDMWTEPSRSYAATDEGEIVLSPRPMNSRLLLVVEGKGQFPASGGLLLGDLTLYNNNAFAGLVGNTAINLRLVLIEKGEESGNA